MATKVLHRLKDALLFFVSCYVILWFLVYSVVQDFDYGQLLHFMQLSWYGGVDLPGFIQLFSLSISSLFTLVFQFVLSLPKQ